jgi:hypothetical protein
MGTACYNGLDMTFRDMLSIAAAILGAISYIPYIRAILVGETKPHRATFGIWSFIGTVQVISYVAAGARVTVLLPLVYLLGEMIVFVLSFKRGVGGTSKLDLFCLGGAVVGIAGWIITDNPEVALYLGIFASLCGFIPTVKKTYLLPHTENALSWGMAAVAASMNLLAVPRLEFYLISYPIYTFTFDTIMTLLTTLPHAGRRRRKTTDEFIPAK